MFEIRDLLEFLADEVPGAVERLCASRGIAKGSTAKRCAALAATYEGEHRDMFDELRKPELIALLRDPTEIGGRRWSLANGPSYTKRQLINRAMSIFVREEVPKEFRADDEREMAEAEGEVSDEEQDDRGRIFSVSEVYAGDVAMVVRGDASRGYEISVLSPELEAQLKRLGSRARLDLIFEGEPAAVLTAPEDKIVAGLRAVHRAAHAGQSSPASKRRRRSIPGMP
jgi:hypothetical protein